MNSIKNIILFVSILLNFNLFSMDFATPVVSKKKLVNLETIDEVTTLFALSSNDIEQMTKKALDDLQSQVDTILAIPDVQRTFQNTVKAFDDLLLSDAEILFRTMIVLKLISPDEQIRKKSREAITAITTFRIEQVGRNSALFKALHYYFEHTMQKEKLTDKQLYFLDSTIKEFKRKGFGLSPEKLKKVQVLEKEISELFQEIQKNSIESQDARLVASLDELDGLEKKWLEGLKQTENGEFILNEIPYFELMTTCKNGETRRKIFHWFSNKLFRENDRLLAKLRKKRQQLAKLLGFKNFAAYDLENKMAKTPQRVREFIEEIYGKMLTEKSEYYSDILRELPVSVQLTDDKKLKKHDEIFVLHHYKTKNFSANLDLISEYFPTEITISRLFDLFGAFFNIKFKKVPFNGLCEDISCIQVSDEDGKLLGHLLLDLYKRPGKTPTFGEANIIRATHLPSGKPTKVLSVLIGNFTKANSEISLMKFGQLRTLLGLFGLATQSFLGRTKFASFAGTYVKKDILFLIPKVLEQWRWDKAILKKISCHYKTGESLPDEVIEKLLATKRFEELNSLHDQCFTALLCLHCYEKPKENLFEMYKKLHQKYKPFVTFDVNDHSYVSNTHITNPGYYSFLWSKAQALNVFARIKKQGLQDPQIGQALVQKIISKGGSKNPAELLSSFLDETPIHL